MWLDDYHKNLVSKLLSDFQLKSSRLAIHARIDVNDFSRFLRLSKEGQRNRKEISDTQWKRLLLALHAELGVRRRWLDRQHKLENTIVVIKELEMLGEGEANAVHNTTDRYEIVNALEYMHGVVGFDSDEAMAATNKQVLPIADDILQVVVCALDTVLRFDSVQTTKSGRFSVVKILQGSTEIISEFTTTLNELSKSLEAGTGVAKKSKDLAIALAAATIAIKALIGN